MIPYFLSHRLEAVIVPFVLGSHMYLLRSYPAVVVSRHIVGAGCRVPEPRSSRWISKRRPPTCPRTAYW